MSRSGLIEVIKGDRRRIYRLKRPITYVLERAGMFSQLKNLQGRYVLILKEFTALCLEKFGSKLRSVVLFGSVARGKVKSTSDLDLLVIVEELPKSYVDRMKMFVEIEGKIRNLIGDLWRRGIYVTIQVHPLTVKEASRFRSIYLDMVFDSVILYDRKGFFRGIIDRLKNRLDKLGARRIQLPDGSWYWLIKPRLESLEVVEI